MQDIAEQTAGFTGADLAAVVQQAALAALTEDIVAQAVATRHFSTALQMHHPRKLQADET